MTVNLLRGAMATSVSVYLFFIMGCAAPASDISEDPGTDESAYSAVRAMVSCKGPNENFIQFYGKSLSDLNLNAYAGRPGQSFQMYGASLKSVAATRDSIVLHGRPFVSGGKSGDGMNTDVELRLNGLRRRPRTTERFRRLARLFSADRSAIL